MTGADKSYLGAKRKSKRKEMQIFDLHSVINKVCR